MKYLEKMFTTLKNLSSTKKHSDMCIMTTSVHFACNFAFVFPFNCFLFYMTTAALVLLINKKVAKHCALSIGVICEITKQENKIRFFRKRVERDRKRKGERE